MSLFFLIGFMGSGKTSLGRIAAEKAGFNFLDMDSVIEKNEGLTISEIFEQYGEARFRELEYELLRDFPTDKNIIIATGGGVPAYKDNMDYMNSVGTTIYISLTPENLKTRIEATDMNSRPLLYGKKKDDLLSFIVSKLNEREKFYQQAVCVIKHGEDDEIVECIIETILNKQFEHRIN